MTEEKTEYPDPTQEKAKEIKGLICGLMDAVNPASGPEGIRNAVVYLQAEYDRYHTEPGAFPPNDW